MRNDSAIFLDYAEKFYSNIFFPYLRDHNIHHILQLGDFFDRRKYINFLTYQRTIDMFLSKLKEYDIEMSVILGNHDVYYKNTNEVNSLKLMLGGFPNVFVYEKPVEIYGCCLIPWMTDDNMEESLDFMKTTKAKYCMGHFDITGFSMYKGMPSEEGLDRSVFDKFELTFSGHYHTRSRQGNIIYVGTPMEITWQDYNDTRGFHIFDTQTQEIEFIDNPYAMFNQIKYDDKNVPLEEILAINFDKYKDTYVKVIVVNKGNPYGFDKFINALYAVNPADVTIQEDFADVQIVVGDEDMDESKDTLTFINDFIESTESDGIDNSKLKNVMRELYNEALNREIT